MSDENPFRTALEGGDSVTPANAPTETTKPVETTVAPANAGPPVPTLLAALEGMPDDVDEVAPLEDEDAAEAEASKDDKVSKQTFLRRVRSLTAKRRAAEGELDSAKAEVAAVKAQIESLRPVVGIAKRYEKKPDQLVWDVDFVDTFEQLAKADPNLQTVAKRVMDTMKQKGTRTVSNPTDTVAPAQGATAPAAAVTPETNELLIVTERVANREAKRLLTETLTKAGVDERYVRQITNTAMKDLTLKQRAELDEDKILAFTKKYLKSNELSGKDILAQVAPAPPAADKRPAGASGSGKPAPASKPAADAASKKDGPTFKNYDEYKEHRRSRLAGLAAELGLD